ncbi:MAG: hypothetical protein II537_00835 [Bacteroidales bacterium]|nr:hypothetical protein [Bacteroidales bacterium]
MKKFYTIFAMAAVAAAFASCNKVETLNQPAENQISIRVGTESKTLLRTGNEVRWSSYDQIRVFDTNNDGFRFTTEQSDVATATFTCAEEGGWTGGVPVMAIHSFRGSINQTEFDGTKVTAQMNHNQVIQNNKSYARDASLSIGVVGQDGGDYVIDEMKNCFSLIKFQLENKDITSVKMRGNNNEVLAGWVKVSYNDGNPTWEVDGDNGQKELIITAGGKNSGHSATKTFFSVEDTDDSGADVVGIYYIAVLPQTLSAGLTLEIEKLGGLVATRTIDASITLNRSKIREFEAPIDHELEFVKGNIILDLTNAAEFWYKDSDGNVHEGIPMRGAPLDYAFDFWNPRYKDGDNNPYLFHGNVYQWSSSAACLSMQKWTPVQLPTIDGYVLKEVEFTYQYSTANPTYYITDTGYSGATAEADVKAHNLGSVNGITRTSGGRIDLTYAVSETDDRYLFSSGEGNVKMILTYSPKSEPEPTTDIVINCENAAAFRYNDGTAEVALPARGSALSSAFDFWLQDSPYTFNGKVTYWSNGNVLCTSSRVPIKVPTISGYTLTEVRFTYQHTTKDVTYYVTDDPSYTSDQDLAAHALGTVSGITKTAGGVIDLSSAVSATDDRYLIAVGEFNVRMILTYKAK